MYSDAAAILRYTVAFRWSIGIKGQKVCQENFPYSIIRLPPASTVDTRQVQSMDAKFWPSPICHLYHLQVATEIEIKGTRWDLLLSQAHASQGSMCRVQRCFLLTVIIKFIDVTKAFLPGSLPVWPFSSELPHQQGVPLTPLLLNGKKKKKLLLLLCFCLSFAPFWVRVTMLCVKKKIPGDNQVIKITFSFSSE